MDFSNHKLLKEAAVSLVRRPVSSVQPFELVFAPAYVFLEKNEKYVSVKGPLDFFTPSELKRYSQSEYFYFSRYLDQIEPIFELGRRIHQVLGFQPRGSAYILNRSPLELARLTLKIISQCWQLEGNNEPKAETFLICALISRVLPPLPEEMLLRSKDSDTDLYDLAICGATWTTFLALHLGCTDLMFLENLRNQAFHYGLEKAFPADAPEITPLASDFEELIKQVFYLLKDSKLDHLASWSLGGSTLRSSGLVSFQKIADRINYAKSEGLLANKRLPSIQDLERLQELGGSDNE